MKIINKHLEIKEFKKYIEEKELSRMIDKIVLHHTSEEDNSLNKYKKMYEEKGWKSGPHLFIDEKGVFLFTDINIQGTHANSANEGSIGIEMFGNYDDKLPQGKIWKNTKEVLKILLKKFNLEIKNIHLHREFNPQKTCPGKSIDKKWIFSELNQFNLFSATYPDFIRFDKNPTKPNEDSLLFSQKYPIFLVSDGVTQSHFSNGKYAFPLGAKKAARIFCLESLKILEKRFENLNSKKEIKDAFNDSFNYSNQKIKELNIEYGIDKKFNYTDYDWFDTVSVSGIIKDNTLYYNFIGDCGLAIFDKNNKKKFQTKDMVSPAVKRMKRLYPNWKTFTSDKRSLIMHRDYRNNPNLKGYGSLSGEDNASLYYSFGSKRLEKGDLIVFYSDGFFNHLKKEEFIKILRKRNRKELDSFVLKMAKEDHKKYGGDRTFISLLNSNIEESFLGKIEKDIIEKKNMSAPFSSSEEINRYLDSL